jgi:hypothetical protein
MIKKFQAPKNKFQINPNDPNSNESLTAFANGAITVRQRFKMQCNTGAVNGLVIENWNLFFL